MRAGFAGLSVVVPILCAAGLSDLRLVRTLELQSETGHVQGIEFDNSRLWVTSVDTAKRTGALEEFDLATGKRLRGVQVEAGDRFHPGGISADGNSLWVPVAEYRRESSAVIQKRSKKTLELESQFEAKDHIGCVAVTPEGIVGGNWDARQFYVWDRRGRFIRKTPNPTDNAYQDMKFEQGKIVASGLLPDKSGAIDWLEYPSLRLIRRLTAGKTDRGMAYTREGMAVRGRRLFVLPEDTHSRLFEFEMER